MKIGYLGGGTWGFCLAYLLANKGHKVTLWTIEKDLLAHFIETRQHPKFPDQRAGENISFTDSLEEVLKDKDVIVESVTSGGVRPVFEKIKAIGEVKCPIVVTSKGIEQNTGLLLPEIIVEVLGKKHKKQVGCLSGPSHAEEVIQGLPTSVVASAYEPDVISFILELFSTNFFRIYPNPDIKGICYGGALKNPMAIACGISDGLGFGDNTKAALMTRGLHEMRKISVSKGCKQETLNGLSGMGDLCVTCLSKHSRNYVFGRLIADGLDAESAKKRVGMVVEGAYTCVSALQLAIQAGIEMPITKAVYQILYEGLNPRNAVKELLQRSVKEEWL